MMDEDYLQQKLQWIKYRMDKLDQIEVKLGEMRKLAEYARDNILSDRQVEEINAKLHKLQQAVLEMDEQSKTFWLDVQ
jgi:hypothetical protein